MKVSPFAYACFVLPCGVIALCFLVSSHVNPGMADCFPFISGCVSISAVARQEVSIHLFRLVMLPMSAVFAGVWVVSGSWLRQLGVPRRSAMTTMILGVVGALFLALYVVFLGTDGQVYSLLRRFGTTLYFGCTGFAQLILAAQLSKLPDDRKDRYAKDLGPMRIFLWICTANLAMGIAYLPAAHFFGASNIENIIEWNFAFLMHINFGLLSLVWRRQKLRLHLEVTA